MTQVLNMATAVATQFMGATAGDLCMTMMIGTQSMNPAAGVLTTMGIMIEMMVSMPGLRLAAAIVQSAEAAQSTHSAPAHMRAVMVAVEA